MTFLKTTVFAAATALAMTSHAGAQKPAPTQLISP